ncbi:class I SAM-dependent methyltransferase [Mesomycoplasma neurolyticum]|uniref:Demethylmenaquinone methyltransferase n=1 Tax=Mesomycoplasma neurolyticum TaxID=2120 RepID=A0A449A5D6_9BACT|nr:class I SAM-dependent methyltransferase [Mesomycoplasma neurolyticum]VEU59448.1 Demethylmenaquinone methyltransferase [Mesomycoplasma neurolyticum]
MINKNIKKAFANDKTIATYVDASYRIGLWKSEKKILQKYFAKKSKILDLGCGTGRTTFSLRKLKYNNIIAADVSPKMIQAAENIMKKTNIKQIFKIEDASKLSFDNESFDNVFFSFNGWPGIVNSLNRIKALNEIYRILKPNGIFIFSAHNRDEEKYNLFRNLNLDKCPELKMKEYGDFIYKNKENVCDFMHLYTINELANLILKKTKFKILEIIDRDLNFKENNYVKEFSENTIFWILQK